MADDDFADRKDATERRVYTLPASLLERLRAYQVSQAINSEAEAARRLLDSALQMRDSVLDILNTLKTKFSEERDLRVLASDILAKHILITTVIFSEGCVDFEMRNGDKGRIGSRGNIYICDAVFSTGDWEEVKKPADKSSRSVKPVPQGPSWEPTAGDLDDEIPF